jgi:hypothetical protein
MLSTLFWWSNTTLGVDLEVAPREHGRETLKTEDIDPARTGQPSRRSIRVLFPAEENRLRKAE